jgi:type IV pilus assembly protein PilM
MTTAKSAWGVEVGSFAVKAVRLERQGSGVKVTDFAIIPHSKVLSAPDVDADEIVRISLGQFVSQKAVDKTRGAISVPGNVAFSAFTRLPPHEPKQTPNLVRFEAEQQIPFPINEVEWDYKTFQNQDSPEVEVGIFALQRSVLDDRLGLYAELGIEPDVVTISPLALYNAVAFDLGLNDDSNPVVILDIATRHSDLIVAEAGRCWFRRLPVGGHNFTMAISEAFKISYAKAERLKQEGATGKYAKQVMQAMRPIFTELLESVQRSLDYYKTAATLDTMIGVGSTFKIPGLRRFLGTQLQKDVVRLDELQKIRVEGPEAAAFATGTVNLWTAYGLALQEVGGSDIDVNLAPISVLRQQMWDGKKAWFAGAAAVAFLAGGAMFGRYLLDSNGLRMGRANAETIVNSVSRQHQNFKQDLDGILAKATGGAFASSVVQYDDYREIWPGIISDVNSAISSGTDPRLLSKTPEQIKSTNPATREMVLLDDLGGVYANEGSGRQSKRFIDMTLDVSYSNSQTDYLNESVCKWLRDNAVREGIGYRIVADTISYNPERIRQVTMGEDGSLNSSGGTGSGAGKNSTKKPSRGGSGGGSVPTIGSGGGGGGGGAGGKVAGNRDSVDKSNSGLSLGSGAGNGGDTPVDLDPELEDDGGSTRGSAGRDGSSKALGKLDAIAPLPGMPSLFLPGQIFYRGEVTFRIEILDPNAQNDGGEG